MDKTKEILQGMFKENTGIALCDSGGIPQYDEDGNYTGSNQGYGRGYEKNKGRDFDNEPYYRLDLYTNKDEKGAEVLPVLNTYHWLCGRVTYSKVYNDLFYKLAEEKDPDNDCFWWPLMQEFPEWLEELGYTISNDYNMAINTYNGESALDCILQFQTVDFDDGSSIVGLQTHNGCDARGGYSTPVWFEQDESLALLDYDRLFMDCSSKFCDCTFDTENAGYTWYKNGDFSRDCAFDSYSFQDADLGNNFDWHNLESLRKETHDEFDNKGLLFDDSKEEYIRDRFVIKLKDRYNIDWPKAFYRKDKEVGYKLSCPECGLGDLEVFTS